jgi:hypothetical protein
MPRHRHRGRVFAAAAGMSLVVALAGSSVTAAAMPRHRVAATAHGFLDGVACASVSNCMAVGQRTPAVGSGGTLAERWNGTTWAVVHTPSPGLSAGARLTGVACPGAATCLAVGWFTDQVSGDTLPTAEKWNGTSWSLLSVPDAPGSTNARLNGVACSGTGSCFAVGASMAQTFIEHWNGSAWSIVPSPEPDPADLLLGVACPSASRCWAVGFTTSGSADGTLAEKWNGTNWTVVHTPGSLDDELDADSCASTSDCVATGAGGNMFAIAQVWNGTTWANALPKKPSGAGITALKGVSCPQGASACESVGAQEVSSGEKALAERWNGSAWALQSTPAISGSTLSSLDADTCTSAASCWAVGVSDTSSATDVLIEHWNGTSWSLTAS